MSNPFPPPHRRHQQDSSKLLPTNTIPSILAPDPLLHPRQLFLRSTSVKLDSQAGATGTSVAQLPGHHILAAPWAALVVWSVLLAMIALNISGFLLSYQARNEFRSRLREQQDQQAQSDLENQSRPPALTRRELKSFTRHSIIMLNSSSMHTKNFPPFRVSMAGDVIPRNVFDRPVRNSVLVAEIVPSAGGLPGDDSFDQFSRQIQEPGFWDRASRKSKFLSLVVMPSTPSSPRHRQLHMMEMLAEEKVSDEFDPFSIHQQAPRPIQHYSPSPLVEIPEGHNSSYYNKLDIDTLSPPRQHHKPSLKHLDNNKHISTESTLVGSPLGSTADTTKPPSSSLTTQDKLDKTFDGLLYPPQRTSSCKTSRPRPRSLTVPAVFGESASQTVTICPDEAVAQYASARANPSPSLPPIRRSSSVLGFLRRSGSVSRSADGHESPSFPPTPVPMVISDAFIGNSDVRKRSGSCDALNKIPVHSIILEEDESLLEQEPFVSFAPISVGVTQDTFLPFQQNRPISKHLPSSSSHIKVPIGGVVRTPSNSSNLRRAPSTVRRTPSDPARTNLSRAASTARKTPSGSAHANLNRASSTVRRTPSDRTLTQQAQLRRKGTTTARAPLSGTMPSAGVRDSSFVV